MKIKEIFDELVPRAKPRPWRKAWPMDLGPLEWKGRRLVADQGELRKNLQITEPWIRSIFVSNLQIWSTFRVEKFIMMFERSGSNNCIIGWPNVNLLNHWQ